MIDLGSFEQAIGKALAYTWLFPMRFARFANNVLKADLPESDPRKQKLRSDLSAAITVVTRLAAEELKYGKLAGGFSRTDALARIGNRVFGAVSDENLIKTDAPVNFPFLWDTAWFDWVQYNASVRAPMSRNIGEALGVGAVINLTDPQLGLYDSTVDVPGLHWMESQLGGNKPFDGLQPPRWDDMVKAVFGGASSAPPEFSLNPEYVRAGESLYTKHCQFCHLPPRPRLKTDLENGTFTHFTAQDPESGKRFLKVKVVDLNVIGTDPSQAIDFFSRHAVTPEPRVRGRSADQYNSVWYGSDWVKAGYAGEAWSATISGATGLFQVTSFIRAKKYQELGFLVSPDTPEPAPPRKTTSRSGSNSESSSTVTGRSPRRSILATPRQSWAGKTCPSSSPLILDTRHARCPESGQLRPIFTIARSPTSTRCSCRRLVALRNSTWAALGLTPSTSAI